MFSRLSGMLLAVSAAVAGVAGNASAQQDRARPNPQGTNAPTREWVIGRWYLEKDQCRGRSFLIAKADGSYVLEEFDAGTWTLSGNSFRREPRRMFLGDNMTKPESYLRIVPTTDRIHRIDDGRMTITFASTGATVTLTRCG